MRTFPCNSQPPRPQFFPQPRAHPARRAPSTLRVLPRADPLRGRSVTLESPPPCFRTGLIPPQVQRAEQLSGFNKTRSGAGLSISPPRDGDKGGGPQRHQLSTGRGRTRPGCRCPPDPRPRATPNSPRFCSPQERARSLSLSRRGRLPGLRTRELIPTQLAHRGAQTPRSRLWSGQCVSAAPDSVQTRPPAASARRTGEPASRGELPRRPAPAPAQLTARLGGGAGPGAPEPPGRLRRAGGAPAALAALSRPLAPDPTAARSPLVPAAPSHGCHGRAAVAGEVSRT